MTRDIRKKAPARKTSTRKALAKKASGGRGGVTPPPLRRRKAASRTRRWPRILRGMVATLLWGLILTTGVIGWFAWDMPDPEAVLARDVRQPAITLVARDGGWICLA